MDPTTIHQAIASILQINLLITLVLGAATALFSYLMTYSLKENISSGARSSGKILMLSYQISHIIMILITTIFSMVCYYDLFDLPQYQITKSPHDLSPIKLILFMVGIFFLSATKINVCIFRSLVYLHNLIPKINDQGTISSNPNLIPTINDGWMRYSRPYLITKNCDITEDGQQIRYINWKRHRKWDIKRDPIPISPPASGWSDLWVPE